MVTSRSDDGRKQAGRQIRKKLKLRDEQQEGRSRQRTHAAAGSVQARMQIGGMADKR